MPKQYPSVWQDGKPIIEITEDECLGTGGLVITGPTNGPAFNCCGLFRFTFWYTLGVAYVDMSVAICDPAGTVLGSELLTAGLASGANQDITWHNPFAAVGGMFTFTKVQGPLMRLSFDIPGPTTIRGRLFALPY